MPRRTPPIAANDDEPAAGQGADDVQAEEAQDDSVPVFDIPADSTPDASPSDAPPADDTDLPTKD